MVVLTTNHGVPRGGAGQEQTSRVFSTVAMSYDKKKDSLTATLNLTNTDPGINLSSLQEMVITQAPELYRVPDKTLNDLLRMTKNGETGKILLDKSPEYTRIELTANEQGDLLNATLSGVLENPNHTQQSLQEIINNSDCANFFFEADAIDKLLKKIKSNERGVFPLGERKDAQVELTVSEDKMSASITTTAPFGGKNLADTVIRSAIIKSGIEPEFCNPTALKQALKGPVSELIFAEGNAPINGVDTQYKALVEEVVYHPPVVDKKSGKVDHGKIKDFTIVDVGDPVMQRTPATEGKVGSNVLGEVIPAQAGEVIPFSKESKDVVVDPNDCNRFIADAKGHPVIMANGVLVDKTLKVSNVDIRTGNITLDGSLLVTGEVKSDMEINVTGDVIVAGIVGNATIIAGNDITIKGGVIGSEETAEDGSPSATLSAGGSIKAQFASLAELNAKRNVEVAQYIAHCNVSAKDKVLIGQNGGKGRIFGGSCHADEGVIANVLGTDADVRTLISVGSASEIQKQLDSLSEEKQNQKTQAQQLYAVFTQYMDLHKKKPLSKEKIQKATAIKNTVTSIKQKIEVITQQQSALNSELKQASSSDIIVKKAMYPNVLVAVNGLELPIRKETKGGHFIQQGKDIKWSTE